MIYRCNDTALMPDKVAFNASDSSESPTERSSFSREKEYEIGPSIEGSMHATGLGSGMVICQSNLTAHGDGIFCDSRNPLGVYQLGFGLGGSFSWRLGNDSPLTTIEGKQAYLLRVTERESESVFECGQSSKIVSIMVPASRMLPLLEELGCEEIVEGKSPDPFPLSPEIETAVSRIANFEVADATQRILLEAKALEVVALFFEHLMRGCNCTRYHHPSVSADDYDALCKARTFIEHNYAHPLTIAQISREVYLNECKLKQGFRLCFDTTIHDYVVECRVNAALKLIEREGFKVKDAAWTVGYSNVSHFITAFKKKHGFTPGSIQT